MVKGISLFVSMMDLFRWKEFRKFYIFLFIFFFQILNPMPQNIGNRIYVHHTNYHNNLFNNMNLINVSASRSTSLRFSNKFILFSFQLSIFFFFIYLLQKLYLSIIA